ncbi:MAG: hypothetical protein NZ519_00190 [Bacteroidia bacterium]|nr:hypothetical protein [Bacteroidia bacterium]MDW8301973.1 hypothetical protein [Bacteroidia bacterium]
MDIVCVYEVLAYVIEKRNEDTVIGCEQLKDMQIDEFCMDNLKAFVKVFSEERKENHRVGKHYAKKIEGVNTCLQVRNKRLA